MQLNIVSAARHMTETVPAQALTDDLLYYSCLAYSSHVMVLQGLLDPSLESDYHDKAINLLIPMLSQDSGTWSRGTIVATTVILRMSEQFSELGDDGQYHLNGAFSVFAAAGRRWSPYQTDLEGVSLWIYLRECIRICFLGEQSTHCDLSILDDESLFKPAPDEVWTNRMTLIIAKLCNVLWAGALPSPRDCRLAEVRRLLDEWELLLPPSFQPLAHVQVENEPFPIIHYLATWHGKCKISMSQFKIDTTAVIGWQFYYTARVMLAVYGSVTDRVGILGATRHLEVT